MSLDVNLLQFADAHLGVDLRRAEVRVAVQLLDEANSRGTRVCRKSLKPFVISRDIANAPPADRRAGLRRVMPRPQAMAGVGRLTSTPRSGCPSSLPSLPRDLAADDLAGIGMERRKVPGWAIPPARANGLHNGPFRVRGWPQEKARRGDGEGTGFRTPDAAEKPEKKRSTLRPPHGVVSIRINERLDIDTYPCSSTASMGELADALRAPLFPLEAPSSFPKTRITRTARRGPPLRDRSGKAPGTLQERGVSVAEPDPLQLSKTAEMQRLARARS